jgi:predicted nucleic acid-binding protein
MRTLVDTNILTRSTQPDHPQHQSAVLAVTEMNNRGDLLCLAAQNLYEFWVVATRPLGENGLGMTTMEAQERLADLTNAFCILDETPALRQIWQTLVVRHDVKGKAAHDARLVSAMHVHGISSLLTFNTAHFVRYAGINVISPDEVLHRRAT